MPLEFGPIAPWLDNWPIYRQLWDSPNREPGNELNLVPANRMLTVQWRDLETGDVVLASSEFEINSYIKIAHQQRGVVAITVAGDAWKSLRTDRRYQCEVLAYGFLYDSFEFSSDLPEAGFELLSGVEVYGAPREILELVSLIPGADVETLIDLSGGWELNEQGYWTKYVDPTLNLYGLFINDAHARQVDYANLALGCDRQFARVGDVVYYKGPESLADPFTYVETAYSRYVLRSLQEATTEVERKAGTQFAKRRVYRELHRSGYSKNQIALRVKPVLVDYGFRVDNYSRSRSISRRFTEADVFSRRSQSNQWNDTNRLVVDSATGIVTLGEQLFDFGEYWNDTGWRNYTSFAAGEAAIEVSYVGGYDSIPTDISEAVGNMAAIRMLTYWDRLMSQGLNSLSIGCANLNFADSSKYSQEWQRAADAIASNYQSFEVQPI